MRGTSNDMRVLKRNRPSMGMLKTTRETNDDASTNAVKTKGLNMLMGKLPQKPHMTRNNKKQRRTEIDPKGAYDRSATSLATNVYHLAFLSYAGPSSCSHLSMAFSILPFSFRIILFLVCSGSSTSTPDGTKHTPNIAIWINAVFPNPP